MVAGLARAHPPAGGARQQRDEPAVRRGAHRVRRVRRPGQGVGPAHGRAGARAQPAGRGGVARRVRGRALRGAGQPPGPHGHGGVGLFAAAGRGGGRRGGDGRRRRSEQLGLVEPAAESRGQRAGRRGRGHGGRAAGAGAGRGRRGRGRQRRHAGRVLDGRVAVAVVQEMQRRCTGLRTCT